MFRRSGRRFADENAAKRRLIAGAVLLASLLAGCSDIYYDRRETMSFAAGDATATAQAVQTIDPWPAAAYNRNIAYNGPRVAGAIERYRTGKIIQPKAPARRAATPARRRSGRAAARRTPPAPARRPVADAAGDIGQARDAHQAENSLQQARTVLVVTADAAFEEQIRATFAAAAQIELDGAARLARRDRGEGRPTTT